MIIKTGLCAVFAAAVMILASVPAISACEAFTAPCISHSISVSRTSPSTVIMAKKEGKDPKKSRVEESGEKGWRIYACIGGGVLVVMVIIGILASKKKH